MLQREIVRFRATDKYPNPLEVDYWIDLSENKYGGIIKYYDNSLNKWVRICTSEYQCNSPIQTECDICDFRKEIDSSIDSLDKQLDAAQNTIVALQSRISRLEAMITDMKIAA